MKNNWLFIFLLSIIVLISSCASQASSTIVGSNYDAKNDVTTYFVIPYGSVDLPGKWEKGTYYSTARQQYFTNLDSVTISISFGPWNKYEFNVTIPHLTHFEIAKIFVSLRSQNLMSCSV